MDTSQSNEFDFQKAYTVDGYGKVAWRVYKWETKPDEDTDWSGYEVPTGNVLAHMIGDDEEFSFDPLELTAISDEDYCSECGQVGCTADGR